MTKLFIDIETYSSVDIRKSGMYKYVESKDFEILIFAFVIDDNHVKAIDLKSGQQVPRDIILMLESPEVLKLAHNAQFERVCISKHFKLTLHASQWECTMAKSAAAGWPLNLDQAAKAMALEELKDMRGKSLITYFTKPCKPTKANGGRRRNLPSHDQEKWQQFIDYCKQDVVVERAICKRTAGYTATAKEMEIYVLDQKINDTGVLVDPELIEEAISIMSEHTEQLIVKAVNLTGLENPNSLIQIKKWIENESGVEVSNLTKAMMPEMIQQFPDGEINELLKIRMELSKTSVKKYNSMIACVCKDNRIRGLLQYYGANRTGRWAGRLVQVQNLASNTVTDLDLARELVRDHDSELLEMCYGSISGILSQLIRTAFIAPKGKKLIMSDFSAIEARVVSWLAGEAWRMEVFRTHGKIYEASGAQMFKVPIEQVKKGTVLRDKAKIAELALGYQGGKDALLRMGAIKMGLKEDELDGLVKLWRKANPKIVELWNVIGDCALKAVETGQVTVFKKLRFYCKNKTLFIQLPSGRDLSYISPSIATNRFGMKGIQYWGLDQVTKQWRGQETYGGKLVENIVQAISRDCLAEAMLRLDRKGHSIVMHVHDEVVLEVNENVSVKEINIVMSEAIDWAPGLPLTADSTESLFYRKN